MPITPQEKRKRLERERKRKEGLVRVEGWVHSSRAEEARRMLAEMRSTNVDVSPDHRDIVDLC